LQFHSFDQAYLDRLRAGDSGTLEHFCGYFTRLIHIKMRGRLKSVDVVEDIRQETFTRFFIALHQGRIRRPECVGSYVNSTCNNVSGEHARGEIRYSPLDDGERPEFPSKDPNPFQILSKKEADEKVLQVLKQLPLRDQQILGAVFIEEQDKDEVCREFGITRDHLRLLVHRAKKVFRSLYLKNNNGDSDPKLPVA
jgi:RNA polymerase sigma-70 factor, ECF subfamily